MNSREYVNKFISDFNIPRDQVRIKKGPYETYNSYIEPGYYGLYIPEEAAPHYRELEAKKAEYNIGHYETVTTKWYGGRGAEWKTLVTIKCAEDNHNTKLEEGMSYTDEVIRFIQDYDNGSMWDKFVVAFEDTDDSALDASDIIEWMQNYPDMYDAFLTEGDDYNDEDDVYEALNRAHELDEDFNTTSQLNEASNKWLRAIKDWVKDKEAANIIYQWYDNEDAFEDFDNVDDFIDYAKDDIYNMLDAAGVEERKIVARALGIDTYDDEDPDSLDSSSMNQSTDSNVFVLDSHTPEDMTSLTIPNGTTEIGNNAFKGWNITTVYIPDSVTTIGRSAFEFWGRLTSVKIPSSVTNIGNHAFAHCESLTDIILPNGVTSIGENAFCGCTSLTSINIPDSVNTIGNWAFENCLKLSSITIPDSVTTIGKRAFVHCSSVKIHCSKDSYAHKYALENNIPVKLIEDLNIVHETIDEDVEVLTAGKLTRLVKNITGLNTYKSHSTSIRGYRSPGEGSFEVTKEGFDSFRIIFYRNKEMQQKVKDELLSQGYEVYDMANDIVVRTHKNSNESINEDAFSGGMDGDGEDDVYEALDRAHELDESADEDAKKKLTDAAKQVKCKLTQEFIDYATEDPNNLDDIIENELLYCGNALCKEFPNMEFWSFGEDDELCDMHGNYCVVETGTEEGRILVQLDGDGRIYKLDESLRSQRGKTVNEAVKKDTKNTKIERPKGYKGTAGGYLSIDRYGTFVSRKPDSGGVQISSANYDWIKDNFDLVEQHNLEYKTMWGRGVVYKIVDKKK